MATPEKRIVKTKTAARSYGHPESDSLLRPDVGTQAQFKKRKEPKKYRYDSSLSPALDWDGQNSAREQGDALIREILDAQSLDQAKIAADKLRRLAKPFLNWAGKAERLSFDVPTLPMFVHERLSTKAILETLQGHKRDKQMGMFDLFGDPGHSIADQVLKAYEHRDQWVNRMILGDSLVVMNSLLQYEGLGGQVQMIYMDPPYGVKFGSNFQPFVRKRDVSHGDDQDMTREPEMVQAYRDTWELGLHSYLTYLRDRLLLCRELLTQSGSIFVQISDENVHHVRELMDEVLGRENFCSLISIKKTSGLGAKLLQTTQDFLLWYAKDRAVVRYRQLFTDKTEAAENDGHYVEDEGGRLMTFSDLTAQNNDVQSCLYEYEFEGDVFRLPSGRQWKTTKQGMDRLVAAGKVVKAGGSIRYKRYLDDFPFSPITDTWHDIGGSVQSRSDPKIYVVQTGTTPIQRCMLMTTNPGDLVLDPTCGGGTTAFVAEQWGRRWLTVDVSRVPLALARQRLLTAIYAWYELKDDGRGPAGGFVYQRKQNSKGEEIGGIVPHITLKSTVTQETSDEEVIADRPEAKSGVTRITGPFCFESTIPTPAGLEPEPASNDAPGEPFLHRMLEILRKSPVLRLTGNKTVTFKNIRPPAKSLTLSAEAAIVNGEDKPVAFVFGPENGAITESLVFEAAREAYMKGFSHLFASGFAIEAKARIFIDRCAEVTGVPATYVQATTDLTMSDLLKTTRSSQIFSVCGMPDVRVKEAKGVYTVEVLGLDVFDPITMEAKHYKGDEAAEQDKVPAWFLDTDYNNLCFHVSQAFFPELPHGTA